MSPTRRAPARRSLLHQQQHRPSLPNRCPPRGEHQHDDNCCISSSIDHRSQADASHEESTSATITAASAAVSTIATKPMSPTGKAPARRSLLHQQYLRPSLPSRCLPRGERQHDDHYCISSSINHRYPSRCPPTGGAPADDHYCISSSSNHLFKPMSRHEESTRTTSTTASAAATVATKPMSTQEESTSV